MGIGSEGSQVGKCACCSCDVIPCVVAGSLCGGYMY